MITPFVSEAQNTIKTGGLQGPNQNKVPTTVEPRNPPFLCNHTGQFNSNRQTELAFMFSTNHILYTNLFFIINDSTDKDFLTIIKYLLEMAMIRA
jgi:hypothetical protein